MTRTLLLWLLGIGTLGITARLAVYRPPVRYPGERVRDFRERQIGAVLARSQSEGGMFV